VKLVIREYLNSLRERDELDAILPDLLTELGFTVFNRPARGTRQFGVDVGAVGRDADGKRKVFLFSIKPGNLSREDWNSPSPQGLRQSLDDIRDYYIRARIPAQYASLPVVICICLGGDVKEDVADTLRGYVQNNEGGRISYQEWTGDRLAEYILDGVLREEMLKAPLRGDLRKAVALLEEPDDSYRYFRALLFALATDSHGSGAKPITRARQINICLWILYGWSREAGNVEAAYRASELAILYVWELLGRQIGNETKGGEAASLSFNALVELHGTIWREFYKTKIAPHVGSRDALAMAVGSAASVDVNLKLFEMVGRMALHGLWRLWSLGLADPSPHVVADGEGDMAGLIAHELGEIDQLAFELVAMIRNNPVLFSPIVDDQAVDIALALTFLSTRPACHPRVREWVDAIAQSCVLAYQTHGHYPTTDRDYWTLVEHPAERTDAYRIEATKGSVLYPLLALWAGAFGDTATFTRLSDFQRDDAAHCNFQFWLPDQESEAAIWRRTDQHGAALCGLKLEDGAEELFDLVFGECRTNRHFGRLSAVARDHWPVLLVACRHYRLPVPPHVWAHLLARPSVPVAEEHGDEAELPDLMLPWTDGSVFSYLIMNVLGECGPDADMSQPTNSASSAGT
jgi:hypothetical protein